MAGIENIAVTLSAQVSSVLPPLQDNVGAEGVLLESDAISSFVRGTSRSKVRSWIADMLIG